MKRILLQLLFLLIVSLTGNTQNLTGYYIGKERLEMSVDYGSDKGIKKERKWFHLNHILIENDTIYIYKEPVRLIKGDTIHSASDGAFFYYYGIMHYEGGNPTAEIKLTNCDYCAWPIANDTINSNIRFYKVKIHPKYLIINKIKYNLESKRKFPFDKKGINQLFKTEYKGNLLQEKDTLVAVKHCR